MSALATYLFTRDDKLAMAIYNYSPQSFDGERLIKRYNNMKKALVKELGEPIVDEIKWANQADKESFNGNAELGLLADKCYFHAKWENPRSLVLLNLEQSELTLLITEHYKSRKHIATLLQEKQP